MYNWGRISNIYNFRFFISESFSQSFSTMLVCRLLLRLQTLRKKAYIHRTLTQLYCTHTSESATGAFTSHMIQFFEEGVNECPQCRLEAENVKRTLAVTDVSLSAQENVESSPDCPKPAGYDGNRLTSRVSGPNTATAEGFGTV